MALNITALGCSDEIFTLKRSSFIGTGWSYSINSTVVNRRIRDA